MISEKRKVIDGQRWFVAEMIQNTTAVPQGEFKDWPAHMQDQIYAAIGALSQSKGRNYELYKAWADTDIDTGPYVIAIARAPMVLM